jgi:large subunit ribosomal protein L18
MEKKIARLRRAKKIRSHIREIGAIRLCIGRTPRHTYAQMIASASTVEPDVKKALEGTGNVNAAKYIGKLIAERAKAKGIEAVAFDRSGFKYHGRIKALADSARENGLKF